MRGFTHRVQVDDKSSVSGYLNQELKRYIDIFMEKQQKVQLEYQAEKTRIRRSFRQRQSERAKNHQSEETKVGLDEKRTEQLTDLKAKMKAKGADEEQKQIIWSIQNAVKENAEDAELALNDPDSIPFVNDGNISTHLGSEKSLQNVLELMIDKLRNKMKTVDSLKKPQIVMLTQDTLKVAALYKALRDKYALCETAKLSKRTKKEKVQPNQI